MRTALNDRLSDRDLNGAKALLGSAATTDVVASLRELGDTEQALAFRLLDKPMAASVFEYLAPVDRQRLLLALSRPEAAEVLESLPVDDQVELLDELPAPVAKQLIAQLDAADRDRIATLLRYPHGSVGRHANPKVVEVAPSDTVADAMAVVRDSQLRSEEITCVFVVDRDHRYLGLVRLADLIRADPQLVLGTLADVTAPAAGTLDDAADAARILQRHDLGALPVVDADRRLVGALVFDDAMDAITQDTTDAMLQKAGVADPARLKDSVRSEKLTSGPIGYTLRVRLAFLVVTLIGGLAVGGVIDAFEDTLASVLALAIFIPLVMDMGGNVGTQSTTIFARGLALGHIDLTQFRRFLAREVRVGATMAIVIGLAGGTIAYLWQGAPNDVPELGIAVGVALAFSVTFAAFLGFFLPWLLIKLGADHAPGADPFITTIKDFTGLAVYFLMASWLLGLSL
ncbi:MAG: magnesium transporter [Nitriliruptor sp.]|nr:MAG: magnesium transporter [Nitriliruptor sp.]